MHRLDKTKVIDALRHLWEQLADPCTRFTMLSKRPRALEQVARLRKLHSRFLKRQRLPIVLDQLRLVIECVDLGWPTMHEQKDDSLGSSREMKPIQCFGSHAMRLLMQ